LWHRELGEKGGHGFSSHSFLMLCFSFIKYIIIIVVRLSEGGSLPLLLLLLFGMARRSTATHNTTSLREW
jgi:hypothetical protein